MKSSYLTIPLNASKSKKSINESVTLQIGLNGGKRLLPEDPIESTVNAYEIYLKERENSNRFRLIFSISPYCTNVLFNPITEIVKWEGSPSVLCLNFRDNVSGSRLERSKTEEGFDCKIVVKNTDDFIWTQEEAIRDTQLSNSFNGFVYHCGIDIFNNHILRNKSFKTVNYNSSLDVKPIPQWVNLGETYQSLNLAKYDSYANITWFKLFFDANGTFVDKSKYRMPIIDYHFNTLGDYLRDRNGVPVHNSYHKLMPSDQTFTEYDYQMYSMPMHLYSRSDVYRFEDCIKSKLLEENGWFGFSNGTLLKTSQVGKSDDTVVLEEVQFDIDTKNLDFNGDCDGVKKIQITAQNSEVLTRLSSGSMDINKTINSKNSCEFVDMYPERELFSFTPLYNEYRHRLEKNWDYLLTYPSSSIDEHTKIPFLTKFKDETRRTAILKVDRFDENVIDDNGISLVTIYSISQHGLKVGETINLYNDDTGELLYDSAFVKNVIDRFIFQIEKTESEISQKWLNLNMYDGSILYGGNIEGYGPFDNAKMTLGGGDSKYKVCESMWVNVDDDTQNLSFAKVINGVECEYYVRKFKCLPNFKFATSPINETTIDKILKDGKNNNDGVTFKFESHASKAGFANTTYSDDVTEIVFTDDVDISYLKDNLGRPLSDIYLTIIKRNSGYKKWYGVGGEIRDLRSDEIEFSHCFGKNDGQFVLSDYYRFSNDKPYDVRDITVNKTGLYYTDANEKELNSELEEFFGDLCCYSPVECIEQRIQNVMGRFNTVQREINNYGNTANEFKVLHYDEVIWDEGSVMYDKLKTKDEAYANSTDSNIKQYTKQLGTYNEGYYYKMHYRVPLKKVSNSISYETAEKYTLFSLINVDGNERTSFTNEFMTEVETDVNNGFVYNEKLHLYDLQENQCYDITVVNIMNSKRFRCTISNDNVRNEIDKTEYPFERYVILKRNENTPNYAQIIKDGSLRYYWRSVITNGVEEEGKYYPFTNGAFYITTPINFYLKRQDPLKRNLSIITNDASSDDSEILDFTPDGESVFDYPDYIVDETYDSDEINDCTYELFNDIGTDPKITNTYNSVKTFITDGTI